MQTYFAGIAFFFAVSLGVVVFGFLVLGRQIGRRRAAADPDGSAAGFGAVDGAVFALLGLLVAFTFSGAASRFDQRRTLIVSEVNDIGTAWLRIDLLAAEDQPAMRDLFRKYLDARLATYANTSSIEQTTAADAEALTHQAAIWALAVPAAGRAGLAAAPMLLLPALNAMFDTAEVRRLATIQHPPPVIYGMLAIVAAIGGLLAGHGMAKGRHLSLVHALGFALMLATTVYVILDLEYPRLGLIRVDAADAALVELRQSMN